MASDAEEAIITTTPDVWVDFHCMIDSSFDISGRHERFAVTEGILQYVSTHYYSRMKEHESWTVDGRSVSYMGF